MPILNFRHVLCPVDLSDTSRRALVHAMALAGWYGARVSVLYVFELLGPPRFLSLQPAPLGPPQPSRDEVLADVTAFVEPLKDPRVPLEILVEEGVPARAIVEAAEARAVDLIAIGTHGRSGVNHLMLGSVTEKVLRRAPCPALVIPPSDASMAAVTRATRVLCPVDFGDASKRALGIGAAVAEEAQGALTVLHVVEWAPDESPWLPKGDEVRRLWEEGTRRELEALVSADDRAWCTVKSRIEYGKPHRRILDVAVEEQSELIVMGVSGRGVVDRAFFGSTTNQVIRHARRPVLAVR